VIVEVASTEVKGDRLRAELAGAAVADWILIGPDGTATLDIRATLRTDDGAIIFMQYHGKAASDCSQGLQLPATIYVTPRFETGDSATYGSTAFRRLARGPSTRIFRSTTSGTRFAKVAGLLIRRSMPRVRAVRRNPYPQLSVLPGVRHGCHSPVPSGQCVRKL